MAKDKDKSGGMPPRSEVPHCSFCGKVFNQVKHLISGENAFICDECIGNSLWNGWSKRRQSQKDQFFLDESKIPTPHEIKGFFGQLCHWTG